MKILQLCKKYPFPLKDGESLAVTNLSRDLHKLGAELHLLTMNTAKHYYASGEIPSALSQYSDVKTVDVDNRIRYKDALKNLFSKESYHLSRFESKAFRAVLRKRLKEDNFDVIQLESLYLAPYITDIRELSDATVVMRAHNVESEIWKRIARNSRPGPKGWYIRHLARKLENYERGQLPGYDLLVPISERDDAQFREMGYAGPSVVIPIGIDQNQYTPDYSTFANSLSIGFIGSLDWMPNLKGLEWFLNDVWLSLRRVYPSLTLHIAGRNTPAHLYNLKLPGVVVHGEVEDASEFINRHSIMVVPLRSGSGMRAKILEGMALGKVVLTTSVGLEGIPARDREDVLVADSPEEFVQALTHCLNQNGQFLGMGKLARKFVEEHFESLAIARRLMEAYASFRVEAL